MTHSKKTFFNEKQAAATLKLAIIEKYAIAAAAKMSAYSADHRFVILDGFAGAGEYEDGSPGSPKLLLQTAEQLRDRRSIECFFVEKDPATHRKLVKAVGGAENTWVAPVGGLEEHIDAVFDEAGTAPMFAFLDPFGLQVPFSLLERFLKRESKTEVLLNWSVEGVRRTAGAAMSLASPDAISKSAALNRTLTTAMGGPEWQGMWQERTNEDFVDRVLDRYLARISESDWHVVSVPVGRRWKSSPIYHLIFMTRSSDGIWTFLNEVSRATAKYRELFRMSSDELTLDVGSEEDDWVVHIANNMRALLRRSGSFAIERHIGDVYGSALGMARETHVRKAIKLLHKEGTTSSTGVGRSVLNMKVVAIRPPVLLGPTASLPKSARRGLVLRPSMFGHPTA